MTVPTVTVEPCVVVVPDQRGVEAFAQVPGIETVVWNLSGPPPAEPCLESAEVLVARGRGSEGAPLVTDVLPRLRLIQLFSAGRDDWSGAVPDGVVVSGVDGVHGGAVAEWVVAQLLAHYRDLAGYRERQRAQIWERVPTGTLAGKRVLVLGAGDIGENLLRRLEPFDVIVTMAARTARADVVDLTVARALLPEQDVVVLALPLTDDTRGLVDAAYLAAMGDGAVLVNVGRGPLVDTDALHAELDTGRLHALLDVTDPEPLPVGHRLWATPGAVITPHSAAITDDTGDRCWQVIVRNVAQFAGSRARAGT